MAASVEARPQPVGTRAVVVSTVLGTVSLFVLTVRFPPADLSGWLSHSTGIPLWMVFALVTLLCAIGLALARRDPGTGMSAVARYANAIVGLLALYATIVTVLQS